MASSSDQIPKPISSEPSADCNAESTPFPSKPHKSQPSSQLPLDIIDLMDDSVPPSLLRHHNGPFDPVTRSAYLLPHKSPLAALQHSIEEILKATPEVSIRDSLNKHVPLQNTAVVSPGELVPGGLPDERLDYREENLIGDVGRWEGVEYDEDDRRAKGLGGWEGGFVGLGRSEPERAAYEAKHTKKPAPVTGTGEWDQRWDARGCGNKKHGGMIELVPPERDIRLNGMPASSQEADHDRHHGMLDGIKRRISLKKRRDHHE